MSHVDEGTLHAYLDGELTPVERERVDTHLKGCPACQARLAEERALIERASRLLGMAAPPERAQPPLHQLRPPRFDWRLRRPLAWAATVILAVGVGWFANAMVQKRAAPQRAAELDRAVATASKATPALPAVPKVDSVAAALRPRGELATRSEPRLMDSIRKDRDVQRQLAAANAVAARETTTVMAGAPTQRKVDAAAQASRTAPVVSVRGDQAAAAWPLIAREPARAILGVEPVVIPGFAVRAYRRNPAAPEIVVEQVTDAGTAIMLIERRADSSSASAKGRVADVAANAPQPMAKSVNERLARFVGPLRVEIEGPLTPDSLSSLLELAR